MNKLSGFVIIWILVGVAIAEDTPDPEALAKKVELKVRLSVENKVLKYTIEDGQKLDGRDALTLIKKIGEKSRGSDLIVKTLVRLISPRELTMRNHDAAIMVLASGAFVNVEFQFEDGTTSFPSKSSTCNVLEICPRFHVRRDGGEAVFEVGDKPTSEKNLETEYAKAVPTKDSTIIVSYDYDTQLGDVAKLLTIAKKAGNRISISPPGRK